MPLSPDKLSKIREKVPEYSGLSDDQLVARLMNDYPEIMGKSGVVDPRMQRSFGTGSREQKIRDVGGVMSGAGMVAGGLAGAASPVPGGALIGSTAGGAAGRLAEMKLYDWLGVKRPDETKMFGLISLGQSSLGKEMYAGALEGATSELLPMAVAGGSKAVKFKAMSTFEKAAKLPPNAAVAATSAREGLGLGVDEITQSPALRGVRMASSKTAAGATKAQMRVAEVEEKSVNAITRALSEIGPEGSPSAIAQSLRGEVGAPGVLGKIENQIRAETAAKYSEIDRLAGGKPLVSPDSLKDVGKEFASRAEVGLAGKGFGKTMRRSPLGKAITSEASEYGELKLDIEKLTKGQYRPEDLPPEKMEQFRELYKVPQSKLTLQEADALRSRYGEIARQARAKDKPDFRLAESATRLKQAIDKDMADAIDKLPEGSEIRQKYDEARKFVIEVRDRSFRGAVKYLSESAPSELAKSISVNDVETVKAIDNVLVKQGGKLPAKQATEAANAREAMRRVWTHDYFFGEGLPTKTELRTITTKARKLSPEFVEAMYGPANSKPHQAFERLVEIGRAVERVDFGLGVKGTSQSEVSQALDIAGGAMIHGKYMAVRGLQRFLTSHFLVKAVNDPKVYDMVVRGIYEYPKNPGRSVALLTQAMRTAYPAAKLAKDLSE